MGAIYLHGWDAASEVWRKCKVTAAGKLIINPEGFLENPPTEDETKKAPTSEWAFDHDADASAHHVKYTDAEARAAINNIFGSDGRADANIYLDYHALFRVLYIDLLQTSADDYTKKIYPVKDEKAIYFLTYHNVDGYGEVSLYCYNGTDYEKIATEVIVDSKITTHAADASAHHARYTDGEAVAAFYNRVKTLEDGTYTDESLENISMLLLQTVDGDINLKGFANGVTGQIVFVHKYNWQNDLYIFNASGDAAVGDKIMTFSDGDESILDGNYGGFIMIYLGSYWRIISKLT